MSEMISGAAGQFIQQILEKQVLKQQNPEAQGKKSFESYLQQQQNSPQTQTDGQKIQTESIEKVQEVKTSGVELDNKLKEMQADLAEKFKQSSTQTSDSSKFLSDFFKTQDRVSLLKEAYSQTGQTSKVTENFGGRMIKLENDFKEVDAIMRSNKDLSTGELLALQARLYQVSQHIEVMSKVVDQMAGGIKTVLNTNI